MTKWIRPSKVDWKIFLISMPLFCVIMHYFLFGMRQFHDYRIPLYSYPYFYFQGIVTWYLHILVMYPLRERLPKINQTTKRLLIVTLSHIVIILSMYTLLFYTYDAVHFLGFEFKPEMFRFALYFGIGKTLIATSIWEGNYSLKLWKDSLAEKEKLEQLTIQQEFDTLKSQVNPHFLFNCFNTLSSLISEDRRQAEVFLDELSKVYRYLLRNNQDELSTLQTEVKFIESYYRLLKTRHGDAVQLQIETDKKYDNYLLPSLSLQMLVENAVKHNVLSRNKPLMIDIFTTTGNKLIVSNNLQVRTKKGPSNKIGLDNIRTKYELLNYSGFQVLHDDKSFSVVLPLIWSKVTDQKLVSIES